MKNIIIHYISGPSFYSIINNEEYHALYFHPPKKIV
uniref:Uncharacterized protein n=1 Tax=Rhizophora mucronata TaxID=61149 RepID=A0A2P2R2W1_RHIMU